ncbi:transposase [Amycolatopsis sp. NPDC051071]|uniref:transposase n=1 Tax=Amycolatopsis sp. NPDC051071 TaxID=3154637 RepID=UPI0034333839
MSRSSKSPEQFRADAVELIRTSDCPLRQVARELGVNHETLRNWVKTAEKQSGQPSAASGDADQDELRTLRKRVTELEVKKEILRKAAAFREGDGSSLTCSYRFISEHRATSGVALPCRVLSVRRPGFYEWIAAAPVRAAHAAAGPCHDNRVSRGWTKIGSLTATQKGSICDRGHT